MHGFSDGIQMEGFPIETSVSAYNNDEGGGGGVFILDNEVVVHTSQKDSIVI